jgi:hypothetical protein
MRATHNQYEDYAEAPPTEQEHIQRGEEIERTREAARLRAEPSEPPAPALPVFHAPTRTQTIPAPAAPSKLSPMQLRAQLLGMHATADRYRTYGHTGPLRASLKKIETYETELRQRTDQDAMAAYAKDRDQQRYERQRAQTAPRPAPAGALMHITTPAPAPEYHEPARCTAPGCRRLAVVDEGAAPHCGAHQAPVPPAVEAARKREAEGQADPLTELDRAIEALIREHHMGAVLDAAWAASARVSPWKSRGQTA